MQKKIGNMAELAWVFSIVFCSLGVCFSAKSGFGVSMVVAPAYIISLKISQFLPFFTFGMAEYIFQGILVIGLSLFLRKFKLKFIFSFLTAFLYGICIDIWNTVFSFITPETLFQRCLLCIFGAVITSFAIALAFRTYLAQQVYELVVKELSDKLNIKTTRVKWIYDILSLTLSIVLMLVLFNKFSFEMVGIGTLVLTLVNTPLIALMGKLCDSVFCFKPAFNSFSERFNKIMN